MKVESMSFRSGIFGTALESGESKYFYIILYVDRDGFVKAYISSKKMRVRSNGSKAANNNVTDKNIR